MNVGGLRDAPSRGRAARQVTRSIGNQGYRRRHRWVLSLDAVATLGFAALSARACCGWLVIQWLSPALYAVGGPVAFRVLIRYEAPMLLALGMVELVAARLARDRVGWLVNVALGALAIGIGALRLAWDSIEASSRQSRCSTSSSCIGSRFSWWSLAWP